MSAGNFRKKDILLMSFAIFDIVNITLYLYALFNMSLNTISVIFTAGICNILFALWVMYRKSKSEYIVNHGNTGERQASYYIRSVFIGALLILVTIVTLPFAGFMMLKTTLGNKIDGAMVEKCQDSIGAITDLDVTNATQYVLNSCSCYFGNGHMFTLVGPYDSDFLISLMQSVMEKMVVYPSWYIYSMYALCFLSTLPFIWMLYRMCRVVNMIRKDSAPPARCGDENMIKNDEA